MTDPCLTPGFVHTTDTRPIDLFYEPCADPSVVSCCPKAVVVSRIEFVYVTWCEIHGERCGGNAD